MVNQIVYCTGRKGTGKTSYAHAVARQAYFDRRRVVAVAPVGGISLPGAPVIRSADPSRFARLRGRSCLVIPDSDPAACAAFAFAWHVQKDNPSPLLLIVDEIALYLGSHQPNPVLMDIIRYGRHRRLSLVTTSQRPASVHKDLIGQADDKVLFAQSEPNDCAYLRKYTGVSEADLRSLPDLHFFRFSPDGSRRQGFIQYRRRGVPEIFLDRADPPA
jgi:hypothetical protein